MKTVIKCHIIYVRIVDQTLNFSFIHIKGEFLTTRLFDKKVENDLSSL